MFVKNERVVLTGTWKEGYFSLSPVSAYNVGGIQLNQNALADTLQTNTAAGYSKKNSQDGQTYQYLKDAKSYGSGIGVKQGSELARFEVGSTVVLVFEADAKTQFKAQVGQAVKVGEALASAN
jgi:phosphatidylserine decarboxylase